MNQLYISSTLTEILGSLTGNWSIKYYELVHHGWVCTIQNIDNWPSKPIIEFFLHSEDGYIDIRESNHVSSKVFGKAINAPSEVARVIEQSIT